jgi:DNA mismatch repair ATPase MutL
LLHLLQQYALVSVDTRLIVSHQVSVGGNGQNAKRQTVVHTQGASLSQALRQTKLESILANVTNVFGVKVSQSLLKVDVQVKLPGGSGCVLQGHVSKPEPGTGRSSGDRQFFYVNGRPVDLPRASKIMNETYRAFVAGAQCPFVLLNFIMPPDSYDVNVTPDKRKVLLHDEEALLKTAKAVVENLYAPSRYTFAVSVGADCGGDDTGAAARDVLANSHDRRRPEMLREELGNYLPALPAPGDDQTEYPHDELRRDEETAVVKSEPRDDRPGVSFAAFGLGREVDSASAAPNPPTTSAANAPARTRQGNLGGFGFTVEKSSVALGDGWRAPVGDDGRGDDDDDDDGDDPRDEEYRPGGDARHDDDDDDDDDKNEARDVNLGVNRFGVGSTETAGPSSAPSPSARRVSNAPPSADLGNDLNPFLETDTQDDETGMVKLEPEEPTTDAAPTTNRPRVAGPGGSPIPFSMQTLLANREGLINRRKAKRRAAQAATQAAIQEETVSAFESASLAPTFRGSVEALDDDNDDDDAMRDMPDQADTQDKNPLGPALGTGDQRATNELTRVFQKRDFKQMKVVGQFNLGFILCVLRDDLFIVDQHASDEIFNFERLQRTTVLNKQPLIVPTKLDLTPAEQQTVLQHMVRGFPIYHVPPTRLPILVLRRDVLRPEGTVIPIPHTMYYSIPFPIPDIPIPDIHAVERLTLSCYSCQDVFLANGFGFCEDAERGIAGAPRFGGGDDDDDALTEDDDDALTEACVTEGCCLSLKSVPFSKGTTFGVSDVQELIGMLDDGAYAAPARTQLSVGLSQVRMYCISQIRHTLFAHTRLTLFFFSKAPIGSNGTDGVPDNTVLRPSRVRAMLAMRACRSSIMIGKALDHRRMKKVLGNLATLKAPWNCPHGRPTMRHLADLRKLRTAETGTGFGFGAGSGSVGGKRKATY